MKIAFACSEAYPYIKVSGVSDLCGNLPIALSDFDNENEIKVFLPKYRTLNDDKGEIKYLTDFTVETYQGIKTVSLYNSKRNGVEFLFIEYDKYFDRNNIYGKYGADYNDNLERFSFFSRAVIEAIKKIEFKPDVIHCNSWQTALIFVYLNQFYKQCPLFRKTKKVYTIHNLSIQGVFPEEKWEVTGLDRSLFVPDKLEFWGKLNLKKGGLLYSDVITTVSKNYSREILTEEFGCGLEGVIRDKKDVLKGIKNGVDYEVWNPLTDKFTYNIHYDINDLSNKEKIKEIFLNKSNLVYKENEPLLCFIGIYNNDTGVELIKQKLDFIIELGVKVIFIGYGLKKYEDFFFNYQNKYYNELITIEGLPEDYIHKLIAASDIILSPSKFEPSGLFVLYALKYGTIPIARDVGALKDIVADDVNGFTFKYYDSDEFFNTIIKAVNVYKKNKEKWDSLMRNAMDKNQSWKEIAEKYVEIYKS